MLMDELIKQFNFLSSNIDDFATGSTNDVKVIVSLMRTLNGEQWSLVLNGDLAVVSKTKDEISATLEKLQRGETIELNQTAMQVNSLLSGGFNKFMTDLAKSI